jgi:multidrug efflux pump subunit AcrA (membrane-fusion protein)
MRLDLIGQGLSTIGEGLKAPVAPTVQPLLVESQPEPKLARGLLMVSGLGVLLLLGWAALAPLDEVARAGGMLVAQGNNAVVQHVEGGLLKTIYVHEGDVVAIGQPLLELDATSVTADLGTLRDRVAYLQKQRERLRLALGTQAPLPLASGIPSPTLPATTLLPPPDIVTGKFNSIEPAAGRDTAIAALAADPQLAALAQRWRLMRDGVLAARQELDHEQALRQQGFGTASRVYAAERDYRSQNQALAGLESDMADQLAQIESELNQQTEQQKKLEDRQRRLVVRAPVTGVVQAIKVNTAGAVVPAGGTLMEIVPAGSPLQALVKLPPAYVGMVHRGQQVAVKLTAYESTRFGFLNGTVEKISADTVADETGHAVYQVWVDIPQQLQGTTRSYALRPGMVVVAAIVTGHRSVLDYLLKPIRQTFDEAWKES